MKKIYRNIGIILGVFVLLSCSTDPLQESSFIPGNPNPDAENLPLNEQWAWVSVYPGVVSNVSPRLQGVTVNVQGGYDIEDLQLNSKPGYLQSTGLYVPPAEEIVVNFSGSANNLRYQVGIASWELGEIGPFSRYAEVSAKGDIIVGENKIKTNFGGHLYFYFDGDPTENDLTLTVDGAVKSSDFILGETDVTEWRTTVQDVLDPMIWGEIIGKHVIMTLPLTTLRMIEKPDVFIKFYDDIIENDMYLFGGIPSSDTRMPLRVYCDVQLPKDAAENVSQVYPYYPMGYLSKTVDSLDNILVQLPMRELLLTEEENQVILKGLGEFYSMTWSSSLFIGENLQKMPIYHWLQREEKLSLDDLTKAIPLKDRIDLLIDIDKKSMMFQLLQEYSWDLLRYISEETRKDILVDVPEKVQNDLLAIYASKYAGVNLTEFFENWIYPVSEFGMKYMSQYPDPAVKFWAELKTDMPKEKGVGAIGTIDLGAIPMVDTVYDRADWYKNTDQSSEIAPSYVQEMFDDSKGTFWHTDYMDDDMKYPHWFSFELEDAIDFNYIYMAPRDVNNGEWPIPREFIVQYIDENGLLKYYNKAGDENELGTKFYWCIDFAGSPTTIFYLDRTITAKGLRVTFLEPNLNAFWDADNKFKDAVVADFGLGLLK